MLKTIGLSYYATNIFISINITYFYIKQALFKWHSLFFVCFSIKQVDWLLDTYLRHIHNLWSVFKVFVFVFIVQKCSQDYCLKKLLPGKQCHSSHPKFCWIFIFQINRQARYYKRLNSKKVQTRLFLILKTLWFPLCF